MSLSLLLWLGCQKSADSDAIDSAASPSDTQQASDSDPGARDSSPPVDSSPPGGSDSSKGADSSPGGSDSSAGGDSSPGADTQPLELYGTWPAKSIPAPEFSAQNLDETLRGRDDLIGHWHVLWFYPAAGTYG